MPINPTPVTDFLSNLNDQMVTAAEILGRSKHRREIFRIVYHGPKQVKTVAEIMKATKLSQTHVLKEGGKMAGLLLEKVPGGYKKRKDFATRYRRILALASDPRKRAKVPTKTSPRGSGPTQISVRFPSAARNASQVTIDDIDSFAQLGEQSRPGMDKVREEKVKKAFAAIIGERGSFKDWGGEKSDLYSSRVRFRGKRIATAFAFKGRATRGKLVPSKMGKNGDQINRLFEEPAELYMIVYGGQIDSSVIAQMRAFALAHALGGRKLFYGVIDGTDLGRLAHAYPVFF